MHCTCLGLLSSLRCGDNSTSYPSAENTDQKTTSNFFSLFLKQGVREEKISAHQKQLYQSIHVILLAEIASVALQIGCSSFSWILYFDLYPLPPAHIKRAAQALSRALLLTLPLACVPVRAISCTAETAAISSHLASADVNVLELESPPVTKTRLHRTKHRIRIN